MNKSNTDIIKVFDIAAAVIVGAVLIYWFFNSLFSSGNVENKEIDYQITESSQIEFELNDNMQKAKFYEKIDGDTAWFQINENSIRTKIKVRFLAIDTPETVKEGTEVQNYGPEASAYTTVRLRNAKEIYLEWDDASDQLDKYDRYLAWIWVDGSLLQAELLERGYAKIDYVYGDYKYMNALYGIEYMAEKNHIGLWGDE